MFYELARLRVSFSHKECFFHLLRSRANRLFKIFCDLNGNAEKAQEARNQKHSIYIGHRNSIIDMLVSCEIVIKALYSCVLSHNSSVVIKGERNAVKFLQSSIIIIIECTYMYARNCLFHTYSVTLYNYYTSAYIMHT